MTYCRSVKPGMLFIDHNCMFLFFYDLLCACEHRDCMNLFIQEENDNHLIRNTLFCLLDSNISQLFALYFNLLFGYNSERSLWGGFRVILQTLSYCRGAPLNFQTHSTWLGPDSKEEILYSLLDLNMYDRFYIIYPRLLQSISFNFAI